MTMATTTTPADIITTPIRAQLHGALDAIRLLRQASDTADETWCDDDSAPADDDTHAARAASLMAERAAERLEAEIDALRAALAASDEPRPWHLTEDAAWHYDVIMASSAEQALDRARDSVDPSTYDTSEGPIWIDVSVECDETGEDDSDTVRLDEDEPDCESGHEHDWQAPYEVVGGIEENPGVWGHGGGIIMRRVCRHCGTYQVTDTWAQRPDTGEQGLTSVIYEEADAESLAWVQARRRIDDADGRLVEYAGPAR